MNDSRLTDKIGTRIVVSGMAGAGKSTFSKALSEKTGLVVLHLDRYLWKPGWQRVSAAEFSRHTAGVVAG
ncbi:MAG: AAA family ATPase [Pseudomonadaceae bacterium]|nr:AAA family ATPase [Pseudomonadaceae bacterium]